MKAKLIKTDVNYLLRDEEDVIIASTSFKTAGISLSKQNCDEIFGVVDVEKLAEEYIKDDVLVPSEKSTFIFAFLNGMELNKDKVFTLEDMRKAIEMSRDIKYVTFSIDELIQSLQQPTEIEVEIEMVKTPDAMFQFHDVPYSTPKLDSEGCLILKRI
jgi:hypothetical protein